MKVLHLVAIMAVATSVEGVEPEVPATGSDHVPVPVPVPVQVQVRVDVPVGLSDFIVPIARDLRLGYSANLGRYHRSQDDGEGTDSDFVEHGLWVSHVRSLTGPGSALSGGADWRAEVGVLASLAEVTNPNGSAGDLYTVTLDLGVGPAWAIIDNDTSRLEIEIMPFVDIGLSRYENDYTTEIGGYRGSTSVEAMGLCVEYGIKANLMWCWGDGWGVALHAGFVQRAGWLDGDSRTHWSDGSTAHGDYGSDDLLTGGRFGLFVGRRF